MHVPNGDKERKRERERYMCVFMRKREENNSQVCQRVAGTAAENERQQGRRETKTGGKKKTKKLCYGLCHNFPGSLIFMYANAAPSLPRKKKDATKMEIKLPEGVSG